jgi:transposase
MARLSCPTPGTGADSVGRVLCGWHLRTRQKGGPKVGKTKRGKGTKLMVLVDGTGTPLGLHVAAASPAEVTLLEATLATVHVPRAHRAGRPRQRPDRLIADRGYDSNAVRAALDTRGIRPIIPARSNTRQATHQDGRCLRRYRRRWIVERSNAWLYNFRRLVVRYERSAEIYTALVHLACALITLKRVFG